MRLIDADKLFNEVLAMLDDTEIDFWVVDKFMKAVNDAPTIAPPPNDPLTLEERLKAEQCGKLRELCTKLKDVLEYEPADSGSEEEDGIWERANILKLMLDNFFEEATRDN